MRGGGEGRGTLFDSGLVDRTLTEVGDRETIFLTAEDTRLGNIARVCDRSRDSLHRARLNVVEIYERETIATIKRRLMVASLRLIWLDSPTRGTNSRQWVELFEPRTLEF